MLRRAQARAGPQEGQEVLPRAAQELRLRLHQGRASSRILFGAPLVFRIAILSSMLLDVCVCARARFEQALGMYPSCLLPFSFAYVTERFYQRFSETTASVAPYARRRNRN